MSKHKDNSERLGDFTTTARVIPISVMAVGIGIVCTFVAWALLRLIGFFTNLFYFGRVSTVFVSPAGNHLGWWSVLVPVGGGLVIGLMAHYGSERIRGHGIPEALESILINGSKVQPRLAVLKPVSAAISIGSGGPFGAEGPIIMTGGALGSVIAQLFHLTAAERKTLLVAGAAAGMSATFATPISAVLLAVELLLFEWKPRQRDTGGAGERLGGRGAEIHSGDGPAIRGTAACDLYRTAGVGRMCHCGTAGRRSLRAADNWCVCGGRLVHEATDSLEVVAGDRRPGCRIGRADFSAGAGSGVRHDPYAVAGRRGARGDRRSVIGEVGDLGDFPGIGDIGRCAGATVNDGGGTGRCGGEFPAERGRRVLAAGQYGRDIGRDDEGAVYGDPLRTGTHTRH